MNVTTQLTSKWLKFGEIASIGLGGYGAVRVVTGDIGGGMALIILAVLLNVTVRVLKWWNHA